MSMSLLVVAAIQVVSAIWRLLFGHCSIRLRLHLVDDLVQCG
jgi:hypothetical protein